MIACKAGELFFYTRQRFGRDLLHLSKKKVWVRVCLIQVRCVAHTLRGGSVLPIREERRSQPRQHSL